MSWSWKIGRLAGINVYMHWTFVLLLAFIGYSYAVQGGSWRAGVLGVIFLLSVFGCVVLHELGHALAARRYGVPTRDITLLPIGGVARLQRMPEHPEQELVVAIAGPLVNVAIAAMLGAALFAWGGWRSLWPASVVDLARSNFFVNLMWVNVSLLVFNLLPAFPMDGGRVLRALLAMRLDYVKATNIAAAVGQAMAIGFGMLGLLGGSPILMFIALFVYLGAGAEAQQAQVRSVLSNVTVREAMLSRFRTLAPEDSLARAADELLAGSQQDFPVLDGDRYLGILFRKDLVRGLSEQGRQAAVKAFASRGCEPVRLEMPLDEAMQRLSESGCSSAAVMVENRFIGLLTLENVGEYMMLRSALKGMAKAPLAAASAPNT